MISKFKSYFGFIVVFLLILFVVLMHLSNKPNFNFAQSTLELPFYPPDKELNARNLLAGDTASVKSLKKHYLLSPSSKPYNLTSPEIINPSMGQAQVVDEILQRMVKGFYIECGALDGEVRSNTLFFEREREWQGLLIEADPKNFRQLLQKQRKAYSSPTCLSISPHPSSVQFQQRQNMGHILGVMMHGEGGPPPEEVVEVQCFPLLTYLKALDVKTVHYFSLDVEGAEFDILSQLPWKELDIKVLSVEFAHNKESKSSIVDFMDKVGYYVHSEVTHPDWLANDFIFVKKDLAIS